MRNRYQRFLSFFLLLSLLTIANENAFAQLTVTGGLNATALAQMLAGPGITVSNATLTGAPDAAGSFNGSASNIGLTSGVILCTGPITIAPGPNNSGSAGQDNGQPGNSQLNGLAGASTYNAVVLEFDFIPLSNVIQFDYVFGSEEYPEFVNSGYNDAFAFYISGPGIAGQQNIALIPGTATPVTIDNVNAGSYSQYYVDNSGGTTVQYDAFTTVLTATSTVQACQTYHLKLMIADAGDGVWDSGVFLAEGSLTSEVVEISTSTASADSTAYENCSNATVTFTLSDVLPSDYTVNFNVSGTATNGTDYPTIPSSVTIPANQLSTSFTIDPVYDGTPEGIETVIIDVQTSICGSDTIIIYINDVTPVTVEAFGDTAFCGGTAKLWAHADGGAGSYTFNWSNGMTGDTIYVTPSATTTYTVSANDYCASTVPEPSADATVTIDPTPVADAGPDIPYCAGDPVTLSGSGGTVYEWYDITNGAVVGNQASITLNPVGDVDYRMITSIGVCSDTDYVSITELPASPAQAIGDTSFCEGGSAQLNVVGGVNSTFSWSPTIGLNDPLIQDPVATPNVTTVYTVTVTSSSGCIKTDSVEVIIDPGPVPDFVVNDVCLNETSIFVNASSIASGSIQSFAWNFGDSATSSSSNTNHLYATDGTYSVKLVAVSDMGCTDSLTQSTTVHPIPIADFSFADDCQDKQITYSDQSSASSGSVATWQWDFGNNQTSTDQNPVPQSYPTAGFYQVQLEVASDFGCVDDTTQTVEIFPVPTANFTFDSVCLGLANQFTDLSLANGNYPIIDWSWSFDDPQSQTSTDQNPSATFNQYGQYGATLTVTTSAGCLDVITLGNAVVHPLPVATFSNAIKNCLNDTSWFEDQSTVPNLLNDQVVAWNWGFGDGYSANTADTFHIYGSDGHFAASLVVATDKGCLDTMTHDVEIYPLPTVSFTSDVTEGCQPLRVFFEETCAIPAPYSISSYVWNLGNGDGDISSQNPMNVYNAEVLPDTSVAHYTVSLQATSGNGCVSSDTVVDYITEYPKPDALFEADRYVTDLLNPEIDFTDKSSDNVTEWYYDFGEGNYSTEQNPGNLFTEVGEYEVTQYVTTQYGCMDTISGMVKVEPIYTFYIPNTFTPDADGKNEEFFGTGEGFVSYSMYIFNRWGEEIFTSFDKDYHWDGTYNGKQVQEDVYVYKFYIVDWKNDDHEYFGHVTLMR
ncbi:MAG: PKD domain-containing protein [Flavobacteriales bacterium]|nr:PKD domain-containing protein [Flavobacteriales bacterium]